MFSVDPALSHESVSTFELWVCEILSFLTHALEKKRGLWIEPKKGRDENVTYSPSNHHPVTCFSNISPQPHCSTRRNASSTHSHTHAHTTLHNLFESNTCFAPSSSTEVGPHRARPLIRRCFITIGLTRLVQTSAGHQLHERLRVHHR